MNFHMFLCTQLVSIMWEKLSPNVFDYAPLQVKKF